MAYTGNPHPHTGGYEQAYREIYSILNNDEHRQECGNHLPPEHECRACVVIQEVVEVLMETLANKLTQQEFFVVAVLLARTGTGIKDKDGNIRIDFWGELNGAANPDGSYEWWK